GSDRLHPDPACTRAHARAVATRRDRRRVAVPPAPPATRARCRMAPARNAPPRAPSYVDRLTLRRKGRFAQRLGERRMGVDGAPQLVRRGLQGPCQAGFGNQVRHAVTDHVHAEDLAMTGAGDELDESLAVARGHRLAERAERELADLHLAVLP